MSCKIKEVKFRISINFGKIFQKVFVFTIKYQNFRPIYITSKQDSYLRQTFGRSVRPEEVKPKNNSIAARKLHYIQGGNILW